MFCCKNASENRAKLLSQLKRTLGENLFVKAAGDINTSQVLPLRGINLTAYLCDMHNLKFRMNLRTTTNKNVKLFFSNACNLAVTFMISKSGKAVAKAKQHVCRHVFQRET